MGAAVALVMLIFGGLCVWTWIKITEEESAIEELERARGTVGSYRILTFEVDGVDLPKLGNFQATSTPVQLKLTFSNNQRTFHVTKANDSPEIAIVGIEFMPQYDIETTVHSSGKAGAALLGTVVAGPVGAIVGSSVVKSKVTSEEHERMSWALVTIQWLYNSNARYRVRFKLNTESYQQLARDYLLDY
ncbi:hypothetical protein [Lacticaseibacillus porcinae]|uniref:hypothetical protein n=1 Tax=Lacticaseibacillus porcinae TaxID=1123687 RepID=UPI000F76959C|nr:hypothetical protein [Lacticaseibacillus porcinae]